MYWIYGNLFKTMLEIYDRAFSEKYFYKNRLGAEGLNSTAQKMKFYIKDFFSKCDQIRSFLQIWSHLLKKSLIENFIFCALE